MAFEKKCVGNTKNGPVALFNKSLKWLETPVVSKCKILRYTVELFVKCFPNISYTATLFYTLHKLCHNFSKPFLRTKLIGWPRHYFRWRKGPIDDTKISRDISKKKKKNTVQSLKGFRIKNKAVPSLLYFTVSNRKISKNNVRND